MVSEDEIADVYENHLNQKSDYYLAQRISRMLEAGEKPDHAKIEDYEREHLISMILNLDWTGKLDPGFEDLRKSVSTNDSCG